MRTLPKPFGHFGEFVKCLNHEINASSMSSRAFVFLYTQSCNYMLQRYKRIHPKKSNASSCPVPEITDSRFIVYAFKRRFLPVWESLNRGFRGLVVSSRAFVFLYTQSCNYILPLYKRIHPKKRNASSCHSVRLYFCTPILQIFYPYTNQVGASRVFLRYDPPFPKITQIRQRLIQIETFV
jgi:hypothetical protein